jgi:hypothetical protein
MPRHRPRAAAVNYFVKTCQFKASNMELDARLLIGGLAMVTLCRRQRLMAKKYSSMKPYMKPQRDCCQHNDHF